mmetsp:Transcript_116128/g.323453  ORF Transcript_116128/g.323453 Transcript_116128/m.323453 type:complete len:237 (-) Transcript_116128:1294-2004(-)
MATPSKTRPVRPQRCFAEACETHAVTKHDMCRRLSYTSCRRSPKSMTTRTLGIVKEDSAMLEARMICAVSGGGASNTAPSCSSFGMSEWRTKTLKRQSGLGTLGSQLMCDSRSLSSSGSSVSCSSVISPMPGKKIRTPSPGKATRVISSYTKMSRPRRMTGATSLRRLLAGGMAAFTAGSVEAPESEPSEESESSNSPFAGRCWSSSSTPSASWPPVPKQRSASRMARMAWLEKGA